MITAIDSNILIDIFGADPKFGQISAQALRHCITKGVIYACEIVWIETATAFTKQQNFLQAMKTLNIEYTVIKQDTALLAAKVWHSYRQAGGKRTRVAADFLIGAHALNECDRLLTRDKGFYRSYFKSLNIIDPTSV